MYARDVKDIIAGAILICGGLAVAIYASMHYPLGTVNRMGPGMFPTALGYILCALGIGILLPACFRGGELPKVEVRPLLAVLASTIAFFLTVNRFGLIPAAALLTIIATLADDRFNIPFAVGLAIVLSIAAALLFSFALGLQISIFKWGF
jgi:hypothetical protein